VQSCRYALAHGAASYSDQNLEEKRSMSVDQACEKFSTAIRIALVSTASLQERLGSLICGVCHLQRDSFPEDRSWDEFRKLVNETTKRAAGLHPEAIHAATSQMSDAKARECLQAAFDIFSQIARAFGRTEFVI
jgi:hypothetical protein